MKYLCVILALLFSSTISFSDTFILDVENDMLAETDEHYTHGTRFNYKIGSTTYILGQNIYTPTEIKDPEPRPNERPYSGWLYAGIKQTQYKDYIIDQLEITLGMVGPDSMSKESQTEVHRWIDSAKPMGWEYQVENRLAANLNFRRNYIINTSKTFAVMPYWECVAGSVINYVGVGGTIMVGHNIPKILDTPIISKDSILSIAGFMGVNQRCVFYNYLIEGDTPNDVIDVDIENLVTEISIGTQVLYDRLGLKYSHVIRTEEYKTQKNAAIFGSISLSYSL